MNKNFAHGQKIGLCGSIALHLLLLALFFFNLPKKTQQPQVVLEVELISSAHNSQKQKKSEIIHLKKDTHDVADHLHAPDHTQNLDPIFHPLPNIPEDLRLEAFNSQAVARFHISAGGEVSYVELIKPCANPRLNVLLLKSLQRWKFPPASQNEMQDISVTFSVQ